MTDDTKARIAIVFFLGFPFWCALMALTYLYIIVPVATWWMKAGVWLAMQLFWWVQP